MRRMMKLMAVMALLIGIAGRAGAASEDRIFTAYNASNGMADNSAQTIVCTRTGRMVITTIGHVNFYDGSTFSHIDPTKEDAYPLPAYQGHYHLYFDKHHHLWLKDKYTVTCVDLLTERFIPDVQRVIADMGQKGNVDDMFADGNGVVWFLVEQELHCSEHGHIIPVKQKSNLHDIAVYDSTMLFQFYANSMVDAYDIKTAQKLFSIPALSLEESSRYMRSSVLRSDGKLFYQIRNGDKEAVLLRFDVEQRKWTKLMETPYHLNNMAIYDGKLYIASEYGYWTYDIATGEANHYEELQMAGGRKLATDINVIAFDLQGGMWVGTERRGLLYARPYTLPFHSYDWSQQKAQDYGRMLYEMQQSHQMELPRRVNCIFTDSRGWEWTGTYTGLVLKKSHSDEGRTFTLQDGLTNEMIHAVIEDDQHNIWVSTSYGISYLQIANGEVAHIESFSRDDNVPNESFVNGLAMKLADGTIIMQSLDHVVEFNPKKINLERFKDVKLYPKLIRLMVNGVNVKAGMEVDGKVILDRAITRTREINVNYDQTSISLMFTGLNYFRPQQTYYRVRVKGIIDEWTVLAHYNSNGLVDSRGMLHLPLSGVKPGKYEIEVQASMSPDTWLVDPYVWILSVNEPWWRTTGVYALLGLLLLALLVVNFIWFNRNMRLRMRRNAEEGVIVKRIKNFAARCDDYNGEILTPYTMAADGSQNPNNALSSEFVDVMLRLVPYINEDKERRFSMRELAAVAGVEVLPMFELMSNNLYKSPRQLSQQLRLQRAAELLLKTEKSIEDVADECRFVSPNYFIASFYHHYRVTPADYRTSNPR